MRAIAAVCIMFFSTQIHGQALKQGSIWYLGGYSGFDFKYDPPKYLSDGKSLRFNNRTSTITDESGNLLFYTNADTVWNKFHEVMQNGTSLNLYREFFPDTPVIVPHPGDGQLYYIFTANRSNTSDRTTTAFIYAVIDISGNGGHGTVLQKNVKLFDKSTTLLSVTAHADESSFWVITHAYGNNKFYAYRITVAGISAPVVSEAGGIYGHDALQMKVSPDGTKVGIANGYKASVFDFNSNTGVVSNARDLTDDHFGASGIEFSPNSELVYFSTYGGAVYQFDMGDSNVNEIIASKLEIGHRWFYESELWDLQLAYDGRIYVGIGAGGGIDSLITINKPNINGKGCDYSNNRFTAPVTGFQCLPVAVQSFFRESPSIPVAIGCQNSLSQLRITSLGYADSIQWQFGDGTEKTFIASSGKIVNHKYAEAGDYTVRATKYIGTLSRTITGTITIHSLPAIATMKDTVLCEGETVLLNAGDATRMYQWSTGATSEKIYVSESGNYAVTVDDGYCQNSDDANVKFLEYPTIELPDSLVLCNGETSAEISVEQNNDFKYKWSSGERESSIQVEQSGKYSIAVSNGRCVTKDSLNVRFATIDNTTFLDTTVVVSNSNEFRLVQTANNVDDWKWNFGDGTIASETNPTIAHEYPKAGDYEGFVELSNVSGCKKVTPFKVIVPSRLFIPNVFTPNDDEVNDLFEIQYNGEVSSYKMVVIDAYGKEVFSSNSISHAWDGKNISSGIFYYQMSLNRESYNGWVHVVK